VAATVSGGPLGSFVGREREVGELADRVGANRLVTITGPGGAGKTRLALIVAERLESTYGSSGLGEVWFVDLTHVGTDDVADAVAARVGDDRPGITLAGVGEVIGSRPGLLVLDNFEHLLPIASDVAALLGACPRVRLVVTSRAPLRVAGEIVYEVPPLATPPAGEAITGLAQLDRYDATRLLLERAAGAGQVRPFGDGDAAAIAEICRRLDGIPLAIELAASRTRLLAPSVLLDRLGRPLEILSGGPSDAPARHRGLRATIEWSDSLLPAGARRLLTRLAVFDGAFALDAVEQVAGAPFVLDDLQLLVDHHLVHPAAGAGGTDRFVLHATIREFALDRLAGSAEDDDVRRRHAGYFLAVARRAGPALAGADQVEWLDRLDAEREDVRAALAWLVGNRSTEAALELAAALKWYWFMRGHTVEGRELLDGCLALPGAEWWPGPFAACLDAAAFLAQAAGDFVEAIERAERAAAIDRATGDDHALAWALNSLGFALARSATRPEDRSRTDEVFGESLALFREAGDDHGVAFALSMLGFSTLGASVADIAEARPAVEESMRMSRRMGDAQGVMRALLVLGWLDVDLDDLAGARARFGQAVEQAAAVGHPFVLAYAVEGTAAVAAATGDDRRCLVLAAAAGALRRRTRVVAAASLDARLREQVAMAGERLSPGERESAEAEGDALSVAEMVASALRVTGGPPPAHIGAAVTLTSREVEVLELVGEGLTDAAVAARLRISVRTVNAHLRSVYTKLGVSSRVAATRAAASAGLL
jgi:non-specific serine/threonine protein kinase